VEVFHAREPPFGTAISEIVNRMKLALPLIGAALTAATAAVDPPWDWSEAKDEWSSSPGYEPSKALCRQVRHREPPAADRPSAAAREALKDCDSEALYYGIGIKADPVRARQCAFLEAEREEQAAGVYGRTTLMTAYANGAGAARDLDVAIHLACGTEGAPAELHGRIMHLAEMKSTGGGDFHFCDDITSGYAMGICAVHYARVAGAERDAQTARIAARWSEAERKAFAPALAAHSAYVEAHGAGEVDLAGTARGALVTEAEEQARDELLALLKQLEAATLPADSFAAADRALNVTYRRVMSETPGTDEYPGAVTRSGIRNAQRAWLRYRDAFLAFAALRYPKVPRGTVAAFLTRQRIRSLLPPEE
jgi:uncharacterized protein YecT (DUF1311 family)